MAALNPKESKASPESHAAVVPPQYDGVGLVETQYFEFPCLDLEVGKRLEPVTLAYETYGTLNEKGTNAILICHALTGDAHVTGWHKGANVPGWWNNCVGPGKAYDTDRYFVICSNVIGGCMGSVGPPSINPATAQPYALDFPFATIGDMINAQKQLVDHLGIKKLLCVTGGSMGGMQALQWAVSYPDQVQTVVCIAASGRETSQQIAFNEVGRRAIITDPNWMGGNYYGRSIPSAGLSVARMIGHITYISDEALHSKFARKLQDKEKFDYHFDTEFEVESYLRYQGDKFVQRFDANSYLYLTRAVDYFDLSADFGSINQAFSAAKSRFLFIAFSSDWLYPPRQVKELVKAAKSAGRDTTYVEVETPVGHDAFLLGSETQTAAICNFLTAEQERFNEDAS